MNTPVKASSIPPVQPICPTRKDPTEVISTSHPNGACLNHHSESCDKRTGRCAGQGDGNDGIPFRNQTRATPIAKFATLVALMITVKMPVVRQNLRRETRQKRKPGSMQHSFGNSGRATQGHRPSGSKANNRTETDEHVVAQRSRVMRRERHTSANS